MGALDISQVGKDKVVIEMETYRSLNNESTTSSVLIPSFSIIITRPCVSNFTLLDLGAAYGTAKSGVGICSMGVLKPDLIFKSIVPIIMAGILGIYGLIVAVILNNKGRCSVSLNAPIFNTFSF